MRKYKNQLLPFLLALLVMANSYCSGSSSTDDGNSNGDTVVPQPTSEPAPSRLTELEKELELVKASVAMKEQEYLSNTGDATRATLVATNPNSSPEEKKLAQERADLSLQAAKKSEAEMKELQKKQAEIEVELNTLKRQ